MAKITVTLEDQPNGGVKVVAEPNFETLMAISISGNEWTSAQAYAVYVLNQLRRESKNQQEETRILLPIIGR